MYLDRHPCMSCHHLKVDFTVDLSAASGCLVPKGSLWCAVRYVQDKESNRDKRMK